jgi:hypothetical protein
MADDTEQDAGAPADSGRARRPPPTIELEATEITTAPKGETAEAATEPAGDSEPQAEASPEPQPASVQASESRSGSAFVSPWVIAPFSGAVAAALVIGVGWMLGWPQVQAPPAAPQVNASTVDALASRIAAMEAKVDKPSADAARADALDKSLASLRNDIASLRAQQDKLATSVNELTSAPRDKTGAVDVSAINDRLVKLEQASRTQTAAIAQESEKINQVRAADDLPLRRVVAASLLDVAVRHGDPYRSTLEAAKALAQTPDELKSLDQFATTGVPNPPQLARELLALIPKLSPAPKDAPTSGTGILDRLQVGAEKLVRIERTDATGNDRGAIVTRATSAALHNDVAEARRELNALSASDRAPVQGWLDKVAARDAALSASRQFADSAMAALAKAGQ